MKIIYITLAIISASPLLSSCTPQNTPTASQEASAYKLYAPTLTKGNSNYTGYISTRKQLHNWLIENRSANRELAKFVVSADLKTQKVYLHQYTHTGSSQDQPTSKLTQNGKNLTLEIYDANTSPIRTKDLRTTTYYTAIIINKNKINKINVVTK